MLQHFFGLVVEITDHPVLLLTGVIFDEGCDTINLKDVLEGWGYFMHDCRFDIVLVLLLIFWEFIIGPDCLPEVVSL